MFSVPGDLDVDQLKRVVLFVMGGSVVTGLEVGKLAITDRAVGRLKNGAQQISPNQSLKWQRIAFLLANGVR